MTRIKATGGKADRAFALEPNKHMRAREASEAEWMDGVVVERPNFRFGPHEWEPKGVPSNGAAEDVGVSFPFRGETPGCIPLDAFDAVLAAARAGDATRTTITR